MRIRVSTSNFRGIAPIVGNNLKEKTNNENGSCYVRFMSTQLAPDAWNDNEASIIHIYGFTVQVCFGLGFRS